MKKTAYILMAFIVGIGIADAAVRDANTVSRATTNKNTISRIAATGTARTTASRTAQHTTTSRASTGTTPTRTATARTSTGTTSSRATKTLSTARSANTPRTGRTTAKTTPLRPHSSARATVTQATSQSNTFGTGYNACRDAYFTCMDQFCSTANDTYRRCICSSKLPTVIERERALTQASDQLKDFHSLNMSVIDKSATEVTHMITATAGESTQSASKDTSASASLLADIGEILSNSKKKSLSTQGTLDIGGNISNIWSTTDLADGVNISNLTGEALYNAVHAQCSEMVADKCESQSTRTMVTTAYGMYIENDCSLVLNSLDGKLNTANSTIRGTENEMQLARLENYNNHNSTTINDCIARVREDITSNAACGTDYVHCLDLTGLYLTYETGEPIYSPKFYQLESMTSLAGDVLKNETNRMLVARLNNMRTFAERGLDTCRDISNDVWDEFLRQAIVEIYQGQQSRVRQVKNECLDVVNQCYDTQTQSLRDFSNISEQLLLGTRLELSEQMCRDKLDACSNLYGGGPHGMSELLIAMADITSQTIGQQCKVILQEYARNLCAVPGNDTLHSYPYGCRIYAPGEQRFALIDDCNRYTLNKIPDTNTSGESGSGSGESGSGSGENTSNPTSIYCPSQIQYTKCIEGYYLSNDNREYSTDPGNHCEPCLPNHECAGGAEKPVNSTTGDQTTTPENETKMTLQCGRDYVGSLYHKMVRYAIGACVRPSAANDPVPTTVLQDVNTIMDEIRQDMAKSLATECERLGGEWVDTEWRDDTSGDTIHTNFYSETSANTKWGYCRQPTSDTVQ